MADRIFWNYLEKLPEQEAAWSEWRHGLANWHCFNTFYTHYLRVEGRRIKALNCPSPCEQGYPRQVVENSPSDIKAVCPEGKAVPLRLNFRDILIYSLRYEAFHHKLCVALKILPTEYSVLGSGNTWHLGDYFCTVGKLYYTVYLTYRTAALNETISSLCQLCHKPFMLLTPTGRGLMPEAQQLLAMNNCILLSMEAELILQPDGSFKTLRGIKLPEHGYSQAVHNRILPIEAYKYLVYKDL